MNYDEDKNKGFKSRITEAIANQLRNTANYLGINQGEQVPRTHLGTSEFAMRGGPGGWLASMPRWTGGPNLANRLGVDQGENVPFIPNVGDPQFEEAMINHLRNLGMQRDEMTQELMNILGRVGQESRESNY